MIRLEEACQIALDNLVKKDYLNGLVDIVDIGDRWLIFGTMVENPKEVEYGNCPYAVDKETGECEEFPISIMENFDLYYAGEVVEVPEEYRLAESK